MNEDRTYDIIIHNGAILTVNADFDVVGNGIVCISDGRIERVEAKTTGKPLPSARKSIDARGGIIMPGLVNTHTHAPMVLFRGLADDLPLMTWLEEYIFKAEGRWLNPETVYSASRLACAEMLLSGTTTCCDGYFFEDSVAQAVQESGMRAVLGQGVVDFPAPGVPDPEKNVAEAMAFIQKWQGKTPLIVPGIFCHSPYTCSKKTLKQAREAANEAGCLFQIHVAETQNEVKQIRKEFGISPTQYLESLGILNDRTLAVHAIWVDEEDISLIAKRGVGLSVTTESEMKLASGVAPVPRFLEIGISVGIGTDGCASNNNLDMFQEMDFVAKLHKVDNLDPTVLNASQVLNLATRDGAAAIGLEKEIGSVEAGKRADLIIIDTHKPHLTPLYDPASHLVYAVNGGDVKDVIIDGRVVVENGVVLTMNVDEVIEEVEKLGRKIAS
ncbi:MAG: amidohydrolase [Deltaproteobacteria bacterium]|nr:amidohydrolase [Deltaproteobacteria bacterium]MBW2317833.1 amidohydrolase [Deltaproteobacteria bacterium]MBW2601725.1 amidohydrolase [Deltaproteobacteria bacterium]OEU44546.1 MAG: amidohydrolase [Desulfobacterales bacterium S7086C20]